VPDIHQQVLAIRILAVKALYRILHRGSEFAIGAAELLNEHIAKAWIRFVDTDGEHQFLDVVIHWKASEARGKYQFER
jgi:hypothetical protein